jgi:hypothetical protein
MNTWSEVLALILRDPVAFWPVVVFYGGTVWAVFKFAYWQRGERERGKMESLEQHLRYMKQKEADLRGAYEAEWHLRTNNENPEVVGRSVERTRKAFSELNQARKTLDDTLESLRKKGWSVGYTNVDLTSANREVTSRRQSRRRSG